MLITSADTAHAADLCLLFTYANSRFSHDPAQFNFFWSKNVLFIWVEAFSHVRTFSWVKIVLRNEDKVSCSRTQHRAPGEI